MLTRNNKILIAVVLVVMLIAGFFIAQNIMLKGEMDYTKKLSGNITEVLENGVKSTIETKSKDGVTTTTVTTDNGENWYMIKDTKKNTFYSSRTGKTMPLDELLNNE